MNDQEHGSSVHLDKLVVREFAEGTKENHTNQNAEDHNNQDFVFSEIPQQIPQQKIVNRAEAKEYKNDEFGDV